MARKKCFMIKQSNSSQVAMDKIAKMHAFGFILVLSVYVIDETEPYLQVLDKSLYKKGFEMLEILG